MSKNPTRMTFNWSFFFFSMAIIWLIQSWIHQSAHQQVPYDEFVRNLKEQKIQEVIIGENSMKGVPIEKSGKILTTNRVDPKLAEELLQTGVKFRRQIESTWFRDILSFVLPMLIFFGIWIFISRKFMNSPGGSFMNIGKSKAKVYVEKKISVGFQDVAGVDEAKDELMEIVDFLKDPKSYGRLGAKMPKGTLLVGPPGTGKTLLAKAVAGEAGVPFFSISGSEFVEMFVGVGAARVRDLFDQARKTAPCIVFIDELDAMGKARGASGGMGGHDEKEQTLNQLLVELDGFDTSVGVIILAATNRPEILDPALLRSGRFDRQVLVDRPDKPGRRKILDVHVQKIKLSPKADLEQVADLTTGFTGADLANLCNEAALSATRDGRNAVETDDFTRSIERIVAGLEKKSRVLHPKERKIVAFHEVGHALVGHAVSPEEKVHKISIIPRGIGALGYTIQRPTEDRYLKTLSELKNRIAILLAGRAAEKVCFDELSTGSSDDIAKATDIARAIVTQYGMTDSLGHVVYEKNQPQNYLGIQGQMNSFHSDKTENQIDDEIKQILDLEFQRAKGIIEKNRSILNSVSEVLLNQETLTEDEIARHFERLEV